MKKPRSPIRFYFNIGAILLIAVAIFLEFKPYITTPDFRLGEVRAMDHEIATLSPENLLDMLRGNDKPVMLVIYASWCQICQQLIPEIVDLIRSDKLDGVIPVFLSMDSQPRELSKYLVYHDYNYLFVPYIAEQHLFNGFPSSLQTTGSHFDGTIPYVGFFDKEGKMVGELSGMVDEETLLEILNKI